MTLGQLKQELAQYLGLDSTTSDGLVSLWDESLLNRAANELATILQIPRAEVVLTRADMEAGDYSLPASASAVLRAVAPPDIVVPLVDQDDYQYAGASFPYPRVHFGVGGVVLVRNTTPLSIRFTPRGEGMYPERLKIIYARTPTEMTDEGHQPWDGQYPQYHGLIAMRAAMDALMLMSPGAEGETEIALRYRRVSEKYNELLPRMKEDLDRTMYLVRNDIRSAMYARGGRYG